jgi:hypothetical protein
MAPTEAEIEAEYARLLEWATITPSEPMSVFGWSPPIPLIVTGLVFSEPVLVESVTFIYEFLISPPEKGKRRRAVPAVYFPQRVFTPGQQLRLILTEPSRVVATVEFNREAFVSWLERERGAP